MTAKLPKVLQMPLDQASCTPRAQDLRGFVRCCGGMQLQLGKRPHAVPLHLQAQVPYLMGALASPPRDARRRVPNKTVRHAANR
jgi:hypothetical protein